jgi:FkbM family methyltransferase
MTKHLVFRKITILVLGVILVILAFGVLIKLSPRSPRLAVNFGAEQSLQRYAEVPGLGRFVVRDPADFIQSRLLRGMPWEPYAIPVYEQHISAGMSVVDIGAYNGVHTIRFARLVGPAGHVYAFEPNPPAYEMLTENVRINGFEDRITCYPYGLADRASSARANRIDNPHNLGGTSICEDEDVRSGRLGCQDARDLKVQMVRIDDDIRFWIPTCAGFAKIDVEGNEDRVLAGARSWLATDRPVLCIEIWDDEKRRDEKLQTTSSDIVASIEKLGYTLAQKISKWDYVFVPSVR